MRRGGKNSMFFHQALTSISEGVPSELVKRFLVDCYVRGARIAAETVDFEGSTAVFTKRRYRDKWNRTVTRRVAKRHNHSVKIKAKVRARGTHGSQQDMSGKPSDILQGALPKQAFLQRTHVEERALSSGARTKGPRA